MNRHVDLSLNVNFPLMMYIDDDDDVRKRFRKRLCIYAQGYSVCLVIYIERVNLISIVITAIVEINWIALKIILP